MTRLLLDDRLAPITSEIGFIELPVREVVDAYASWQEEIEGKPALDVREVDGALEDVLTRLLPLVDISPCRYAFVAAGSGWTAYFDNEWRGTDAFPPMSFLAEELGCRALRVVARSDAALLEVYGPRETEWLNVERAVGAVHDGDRWTFVDQGRRLAFEDESRYGARRIRDRFTLELLEDYAARLGVRPLDDAFYAGPAFVLERRRPPFRHQSAYSLDEARAADAVPPPLAVPHAPSLLGRVRSLLPRRR